MKRQLLLLGVCFALLLLPGLAQARQAGMSVTCDNGSNFDNGVEVSIYQLRTGFSYQATAIGLNGFDPVLAVLDTRTGEGLCDDDNSGASGYSANLPTTGSVPASNLSSQINFTPPNTGNFADVSLVVGGYGNQSGEFILILEGMGVTSGDGAGDSFSVNITQGMVDSGVPLTVYMLARTDTLDAYIYQADSSLNAVTDNRGNVIGCDDAGDSSLCSGDSVNLSNASLTLSNGTLGGWDYDAMLSIPLSGMTLNSDSSFNYMTFVMSSSPQNATEGQYVLAFHIGMAEPAANNGKGSGNNGGGNSGNGSNFSGGGESSGGNESAPTAIPQNTNNSGSQGVSVTCDDGTSFDNGVEVIINQVRSGFTYTATAIGLNGFDPVLAVLDTETGEGLCSDDDSAASGYAANLPTTGSVPASNLTAQVDFNQTSGNAFANISLVVGGYGNQGGEFLLILEGMGATAADHAGDIYDVNITPGMVDSGVPMTIYMIASSNDLDPFIVRTNADLEVTQDSSGNTVSCDDAGNANLCWGNSVDLSDSSVTLSAGRLPGGPYDSMLNFDLTGLQLSSDMSQNYVTFVMRTSPENETEGPYVLVFHIGQAG
ncbi:MAG: hypothetical protein IT319_20965 [Anaerolineae bacterium]|nr:hypothetical protein [Anaerolineae bacterium]